MADLIKQMQYTQELSKEFTPQQIEMFQAIAADPELAAKVKIMVRTPGTEPKLNGLSADDIEEVLAGFENGHPMKKKELVEALNGNPKSSKDNGKVDKILASGDVHGLQIVKGTRSTMTVQRLNGPTDNNDSNGNGTKKK